MPFVKGQSGNPKGRGLAKDLVNPKSLSNSENRELDMRKTLRRLKPLNNKAITVLAKMLDDDATTEAAKIKISAFIMKVYQEMMDDLDKPEKLSRIEDRDETEEDEKEPTPIISFKVMNGGQG